MVAKKLLSLLSTKTDVMILYIVGISCAGKTTIGKMLATKIDSKPITVEMDEFKKIRYLQSIEEDYTYFKKSYARADLEVNIENIPLKNLPDLIINELQKKGVRSVPFT